MSDSLRCDQTFVLTGVNTATGYPQPLGRIKYHDKQVGKVFSFLTNNFATPANTGDFRLMDGAVVDALGQLPERNRFLKGLFSWAGFGQTAIILEHAPRAEGVSKWGIGVCGIWRWTAHLGSVLSPCACGLILEYCSL
jgi:hypothetical protein